MALAVGPFPAVDAAAQSAQSAARYAQPYPATGEQLWAKLRTIVNTPGGDVTPQQVQAVLGVRLSAKREGNPQNQYIEYYADLGKTYLLTISLDNFTYFNPTLHKRLVFRSFSAGWNRTGPHGEFQQPEVCMRADNAVTQLKSAGWVRIKGYQQPLCSLSVK